MHRKSSVFAPDLVALLFLGAMVAWFTHEMVWGGKIPFFRDMGVYFYPMRFSLAQSLQAGEIPLWDRHMSMGFPLLADFQSGAFYPPHIFFLVFHFFNAISATFLFHYLVAAVGGYALCRRWDCSPCLALIGAALFVFGGTIVSLTNLLNHFQTAVWLPWALFFWERALRSGTWRDFLALTFLLLVQFLAGSPEFYLMSLGLLWLDGLRIKAVEGETTHKRIFFLLFSTNALLSGIAMIQILPTAELFFQSRAPVPVSFGEHPLWSLHPLNLVNIFFLDKEVDLDTGHGVRLFFVREIPFIVSHYAGAIVLFGVYFWLLRSSLKERIVVLTLVAISLILTLGGHTPVYPFLYRYLPLMSYFRFPEKFFFLAHALLLYIAIRGLLCAFDAEGPSLRRALLGICAGLVLFLLVYLFLRFNRQFLINFIAWTQGTSISTAVLHASSAALVSVERQLILAFGIFLLFFLRNVGRLRSSIFKILLVTIVFIDVDSAHRPHQYLLDPRFIDGSQRVMAAPDSNPSRFFYYPGDGNLHPSYYTLLKPPSSFAELHQVIFSNLVPHTGIFYGFDYMQEIDALRRWPYLFFLDFANRLPPDRLYRLLRAVNVEYIVSFHRLPGGIEPVRYFPEYPSWLYKLKDAVPRAYIVPITAEEKDPVKILDQLSSAQFDLHRRVILQKTLEIPPRKDFQARAVITRYRNHEATIEASLNAPGVLVLADSYYPGWRVYVDGKEEEILRANLFFRGVVLPAGAHVVEFRYQPRSFAVGLGVSLFSLCVVVICSLFFYLRARHTSSSTSHKAGNFRP